MPPKFRSKSGIFQGDRSRSSQPVRSFAKETVTMSGPDWRDSSAVAQSMRVKRRMMVFMTK